MELLAGERLADTPQFAAEVAAGVLIEGIGPELAGEFFAAVGGAGGEDEKGKQRLTCARGDEDPFTVGSHVELP